ncbi:hypothetical protein HDU76_012157 [Blyttiomyces sp. JEL0837]|nr:hypothetical protein HDU76_012157 [Blyttiomyces sp. JEL0837]
MKGVLIEHKAIRIVTVGLSAQIPQFRDLLSPISAYATGLVFALSCEHSFQLIQRRVYLLEGEVAKYLGVSIEDLRNCSSAILCALFHSIEKDAGRFQQRIHKTATIMSVTTLDTVGSTHASGMGNIKILSSYLRGSGYLGKRVSVDAGSSHTRKVEIGKGKVEKFKSNVDVNQDSKQESEIGNLNKGISNSSIIQLSFDTKRSKSVALDPVDGSSTTLEGIATQTNTVYGAGNISASPDHPRRISPNNRRPSKSVIIDKGNFDTNPESEASLHSKRVSDDANSYVVPSDQRTTNKRLSVDLGNGNYGSPGDLLRRLSVDERIPHHSRQVSVNSAIIPSDQRTNKRLSVDLGNGNYGSPGEFLRRLSVDKRIPHHSRQVSVNSAFIASDQRTNKRPSVDLGNGNYGSPGELLRRLSVDAKNMNQIRRKTSTISPSLGREDTLPQQPILSPVPQSKPTLMERIQTSITRLKYLIQTEFTGLEEHDLELFNIWQQPSVVNLIRQTTLALTIAAAIHQFFDVVSFCSEERQVRSPSLCLDNGKIMLVRIAGLVVFSSLAVVVSWVPWITNRLHLFRWCLVFLMFGQCIFCT